MKIKLYIFNRIKKLLYCCTIRYMSETHIFKHNCSKIVNVCKVCVISSNIIFEKLIAFVIERKLNKDKDFTLQIVHRLFRMTEFNDKRAALNNYKIVLRGQKTTDGS